jgi:hypothetical protein
MPLVPFIITSWQVQAVVHLEAARRNRSSPAVSVACLCTSYPRVVGDDVLP